MKVDGTYNHIYIAGNAAIVPPVGIECGHGFAFALVVDFYHNRIVFIFQQRSNFVVERSKTANVFSQFSCHSGKHRFRNWRRQNE